MSFLPAQKNFKIFIGPPSDTFRYRFLWQYQTGNSVLPVNLENFNAVWTIKPTNNEGITTVYTNALNAHGSGVNLGGKQGWIDMILADDDTAELNWFQAAYSLAVISPAPEEKFTLLAGKLSTVRSS